MRLLLTLVSVLLLASCGGNTAKRIDTDSLVSLEKYTIPMGEKGATISKVLGIEGIVALEKDTAKLFQITADGQIALKPEVELNAESPMSYEIEIAFGEETKAFVLVKDEFLKNKVVAHRGAWKHTGASQNSLGSLKQAIALGCQGSEFDVWYSSDNEIILSHDPEIGGKKLEETTGAELRQVALNNGEFVPTLQQYLELIKTQNKTRIVLEIKVSHKGAERNKELTTAAVQMVHDLKAQAWVDYISFSFDNMATVAQLDKSAHTAYLETNRTLEDIKAAGISGIDYHFSAFQRDSTLVTRCNELGLTTNFWTVNKEEVMQAVLEADVDFITTDEPEILLEMIKNK